MKKLFTLLFMFIAIGAMQAQTVPDTIDLGGNFIDNATDQNEITTLTVPQDSALNVFYSFYNLGPAAYTDTIWLSISIMGNPLGDYFFPPMNFAAETGYYNVTELLTAEQIDTLGLAGQTLPVTYTISSVGDFFDADMTNNEATLIVTFGAPVSINEMGSLQIVVYPNPAKDFVTLTGVENSTIAIFDVTGKMMEKLETVSPTQTINVANYAEGLYLIQIMNGNNISTKKLNIVR